MAVQQKSLVARRTITESEMVERDVINKSLGRDGSGMSVGWAFGRGDEKVGGDRCDGSTGPKAKASGGEIDHYAVERRENGLWSSGILEVE